MMLSVPENVASNGKISGQYIRVKWKEMFVV